jgi:SPP1 gp7 family putative phage head morphogenesis protein
MNATLADRIWSATVLPMRHAAFALTEADGGTGTVYDTAEQFRTRLARLELDTVGQVLDQWQNYKATVSDQLDAIEGKLNAALADGTDPGDLYRIRQRLEAHFEQVYGIIDEYAARVDDIVFDGMQTAGQDAARAAEQLASLQLGDQAATAGLSFDRLPKEAVEQLIGQMHDGPLADLIGSLAGDVTQGWKDTMAQGLAQGLNPRDVARRIVAQVDVPRWRALTIARTETLRAYRETTRASIQRNQAVMQGWRWSAALDARTCAVCWAMHGTLHATDQVMGTHPNCRCAMVPATKSFADLGIAGVADGPNLQLTPGPQLFARQPVNVQMSVLGPAKHRLYQDGALSLEDLVGERLDRRWGATRFERSLADVTAGT